MVPVIGLVLTHSAYLRFEGGYIIDDAPESMCEIAVRLGLTNFVLPGTKAEVIKHFSSGPFAGIESVAVMMRGIGAQRGSLSAIDAAAPHRRFAIVGSAIYYAADPKMALKSLVREVGS